MESLTSKLLNFSNFLNASWKTLEEAIKGPSEEDIKDDWLQANWELLVERELDPNIWLTMYGNGADCYGRSSRVSYHEKLPTHTIVCRPKKNVQLKDYLSDRVFHNKNSNLIFDRFVSSTDDGWYAEKEPFDKVLCLMGDSEVILELAKVEFNLRKLGD